MLLLLFKSAAPVPIPAQSVGAGGGKRTATAEDWLRFNKRLNIDVEEPEPKAKTPARVRRTKDRIISQAAQISVVDDTAAQQLRDLWRRWYLSEMGQVSADESYNRFTEALAIRLADERMESEIEDMLILLAVAAVI